MGIKAIFDTSSLIFLAKLSLLEDAISLFESSLITGEVLDEILARKDYSSDIITKLIEQKKLLQIEVKNKNLLRALNKNLGKGEASSIALVLEREDLRLYVILDDYTARKIAINLGLRVKGTLGIIRKLYELNRVPFSVSCLYKKLQDIGFRIKEEIFREIFKEYL